MPWIEDVREEILAALLDRFGASPPWGDKPRAELTEFEQLAKVMLGLVATPARAAAAFAALRDADLIDPARLAAASPLEVDEILKHDRVAIAIKSLRPLQKLAGWASEQVVDQVEGRLTSQSTATIREEWRAINGIGLATADALLLRGLGRPSYPLDRATYRVLVRHGWLELDAGYDEARELVEKFAARPRLDDIHGKEQGDNLDQVAVLLLLENLSFWFERVGREFCRPTQAHCERCPLNPWLPAGGPVEAE